jgi:hypothetical protein
MALTGLKYSWGKVDECYVLASASTYSITLASFHLFSALPQASIRRNVRRNCSLSKMCLNEP